MSSTDSPHGATPLPPTRLNGWKEIAAYFGKGVRTVQRWEKELGLPVHRIGSAAGEIVYAMAPELDAWQASATAKKGLPDATAINGGHDRALPVLPPRPVSPPEPVDQPQNGPRSSRLRRTTLLLLFCIVALVVGTLLWSQYVRPAAPRQPHSWRIVDKALEVFDADGRPLWRKRFEFPLTEEFYTIQYVKVDYQPSVVTDDIDGDGQTELLFVSEPWNRASRGLYCFNHDGTLRFHHPPNYTVRYLDLTAGPPWRSAFVLAVGESGKPHDIWFVSTHATEFPTVLEKLDPSGHVRGEYWSNGQIARVVVAELAHRPMVFVGAVNNEFKGGSLAVLDARQPYGSAPATSDHYRCAGCPDGNPLAFLVFPPLDVASAVGSHAPVMNVFVDAVGDIMVDVQQPAGDWLPPELQTTANSLYRLDSLFRVKSAELGERVAVVHRALEQHGLFDHPFSIARDSLQLWPVLRWNGHAFIEVHGPETVK